MFSRKYIIIAVILSVPILSPDVSLARHSLNRSTSGLLRFSSSAHNYSSFIAWIFPFKFFKQFWFVIQSQIPSHAMKIYMSSLLRYISFTSGKDVTAYYLSGKMSFFLNSRSPNALLKAKVPSTRFIMTECPAFCIRSSSLWS